MECEARHPHGTKRHPYLFACICTPQNSYGIRIGYAFLGITLILAVYSGWSIHQSTTTQSRVSMSGRPSPFFALKAGISAFFRVRSFIRCASHEEKTNLPASRSKKILAEYTSQEENTNLALSIFEFIFYCQKVIFCAVRCQNKVSTF